jgi:hypothetical protein
MFVPVVLAGCLSTACTAGREESVPTTAAPTTAAAVTAPATTEASTTTAPMAAPATTVAPTTVAPTTVAPTTTLPVTTGIVLPPDLGHLVASAPGVSTPGDIWQLAPKLWLFLPSESAGDPNLTPPKPEDAEILIAYARMSKVLNLAASQRPIDYDTDAVRDVYTAEGFAGRRVPIDTHSAQGRYMELGNGIVFRPRVLSEPRSEREGLVFDCTLDWSYWADIVSGEPVAGELPGPKKIGIFATVPRLADRGWVVDLDGPEELACAR